MIKFCMLAASLLCLTAFTFHAGKTGILPLSKRMIHQVDTGTTLMVIEPGKVYQTIHSFGASDCWTAKFAGTWKDERKRNAIADLLFSKDLLADGSPKGIGLSLWRFNIGAGSLEQGTASGIADEYRREECFLGADAKYNWNKEAGAQWFLRAAKKRGVQYLLGFTNSAPVQFTQNGLASGLASNNFSCKENRYNDFADFLVQVCKHFKAAGTPLDFISPVNEPQWKWGEHADQEGSGATNEQIAGLIKVLATKIQSAGITTKIAAAEAGQINYLYATNATHTGNQLQDFFDPASPNYLGRMPSVEKVISYHSYFSTCPDTMLVKFRTMLEAKRQLVDPSLQLWQSEFGVLGSICGKLNGGPRNTGIDYGLYVATVMQADLAVAGVSSFQWWLAINPYDYSDGLVYINAPDGSINAAKSKEDGIVSSSKQLWCMGNFSRFIRPGMQRVSATIAGNPGCLVSSYTNTRTKQLVTVIVNNAVTSLSLQLQVVNATTTSVSCYTTSASENMQKSITAANHIVIGAKTVTTLVTEYK